MATGRMDPDVAAGMSSLTRVPTATKEDLIELDVMRSDADPAGDAAETPADDVTESSNSAQQNQPNHSDYFARSQVDAQWNNLR